MNQKFISFSPPLMGKEEIAGAVQALKSGWLTTGPQTKQFEENFKKYVHAEAALAVNSCTAALHLALIALKIGPGDEVLTTPVTFCSGVHVIEHVGARPVLADVERETLNIDPRCADKILKNLRRRKKIKAIIVVHYAGHPCRMDALMKLSKKYRVPVIEDAAHAFPAKYKGKMIGSSKNLTAFSFYATKNITTGEGGMLTGPKPLVDRARVMSLHGMNRDAWKRYSAKGSWFYEVIDAGYKYNLTDIQSAIGLAQLKKMKQFHARRRDIVKKYQRAFSKFAAVETPVECSEVESAWHLYPIRLHLNRLRISRSRLIEELKRRGVGASVHFIPIHLHPYYRKKYGWRADAFPVAYREYQRLVSLPLSPAFTDAQVARVIKAVQEILKKYSRSLL